MKAFFKKRRELIFFSASILLLLIGILYAFQSTRFLVMNISSAVDSEGVRLSQEPIRFELERFEELGLDPAEQKGE